MFFHTHGLEIEPPTSCLKDLNIYYRCHTLLVAYVNMCRQIHVHVILTAQYGIYKLPVQVKKTENFWKDAPSFIEIYTSYFTMLGSEPDLQAQH